MATYTDRITHVRRVLEESTTSVWSDETLAEFYNQGLLDAFQQTRDDYWLGSTTFAATGGTQGYARPTNDAFPVSLQTGYSTMQRITRDELSGRDLTASGTPWGYYTTTASIMLYPNPDTAATFTYNSYRYPVTVSGTMTVPCPTPMLRAIDAYTLARAYEQIGDWESSTVQQKNYDRFIAEAVQYTTFDRQYDRHVGLTETY